jgi:hypothetical protein
MPPRDRENDEKRTEISGEHVVLPLAALEHINASIAALTQRLDTVLQENQAQKLNLAERLGDGNTRMSLLENRVSTLESKARTVEEAHPAQVKSEVASLRQYIESSNLPAMSATVSQMCAALNNANLPAIQAAVANLQARDAAASESRLDVVAIKTKLQENDARQTRTPHWALLAVGTAAITTIIGMLLNAWVVIPSATKALAENHATQKAAP